MIRFSFAVASLVGLVGFAAPSRADDLHVEIGFGDRGGRRHGGFFGIGYERPIRAYTPAPVFVDPAGYRPTPILPDPYRQGPNRPEPITFPTVGAEPAPWGRGGAREGYDREPRRPYIPAHIEIRNETVCEPAIYEDRVVPVFEDRCVPLFEQVTVPVFEDRREPLVEWVVDPRTGHRRQVVVGQRTRHVQVGERTERVKVGERHEQVQVGTRVEHVLVRAEARRVVQREEWVAGRYADGREEGREVGRDGGREFGRDGGRDGGREFGHQRRERDGREVRDERYSTADGREAGGGGYDGRRTDAELAPEVYRR